MATYYVRTDGSNGNAGTSDSAGGAWADPGYAAAQLADGDICYVKSGTYSLTTSTPGAGGPVVLPNHIACRMEGYESTAGDECPTDNFPVLDANAQTGITLFTADGNYNDDIQGFVCLEADGQDGASTVGFKTLNGFAGDYTLRCVATDCPTGFDADKLFCINCRAFSCATYGFNNATGVYGCVADTCGVGFDVESNVNDLAVGCIAHDCTGNGFASKAYNGGGCINCLAYNNTGHGFTAGFDMVRFLNCASINNTGKGFNNVSTKQNMFNCAVYNNTGGNTTYALTWIPLITLTGNPFDNAATDDFRPNNVSGEGANLRAAGVGPFGQTNNLDIGAVQHADPAGGGGVSIPNTRRNSMIGR